MTSRQLPKPYVLYHAGCIDGFTAAYAAWKWFGDEGAHYVPHSIGAPLPEFKEGAPVYFVDLSLPRAQLQELATKQQAVIILDHHKTAEADLKDIERDADNIRCVFDMNRSGATIAWDFFVGTVPRPAVVLDVEDRDLWRKARPHSEEVHQALTSYEQSFEIWDDLMKPELYSRLIATGSAMLRQQKLRIDVLLNEARRAVIEVYENEPTRVYEIPAVNAPWFLSSDLGNDLLDKFPKAPFAATYRDNGDGSEGWSLRSRDDRVDVGEVAKAFDGGGHRNSAGFRIPPIEYLKWSLPAALYFLSGKYTEKEKEVASAHD